MKKQDAVIDSEVYSLLRSREIVDRQIQLAVLVNVHPIVIITSKISLVTLIIRIGI